MQTNSAVIELKVGDKVVIEPLRNAARGRKDIVLNGEVTKIGYKYYYIRINNFQTETFGKEDLYHHDNNNHFEYQAYVSEKEYQDEVMRRKLLKDIRQGFSYMGNACESLNVNDLEVIYALLFKNSGPTDELVSVRKVLINLINAKFKCEEDRQIAKECLYLAQK